MLSYKHAFHVGNHADVIKHLCLIATLEHYKKKSKAFCLFDTHAGAGTYLIVDSEVQKNKEFSTGIEHFIAHQAKDDTLQRYLRCLTSYHVVGKLPGSPAIGLDIIRDQDSLILMELHPSESQKLKSNLLDQRVSVHARDGFEGLIALSPPKEKRGIVLIDPPYEQLAEYSNVVSCVKKVLRRWQNVCVIIWYPLLGARAGTKSGKSELMLDELKALTNNEILNVQLCVDTPQENEGMYGSGIAIINPPWQLDETLKASVAEIADVLNPSIANVGWL